MDLKEYKPKSFWQRPEGITGMIFLAAILIGGGFLLVNALPWLVWASGQILYLTGMLVVLAAIIYMVLDPKMRNLVGYMYKSVMRWITGIFVQIDPIGILKSYVEDLKEKLRQMNRQISQLRGQMHKMKEIIHKNKRQIESNLDLASKAKEKNKTQYRHPQIPKSRPPQRVQHATRRPLQKNGGPLPRPHPHVRKL